MTNKKANVALVIVGIVVAIVLAWFFFWVLIPAVKRGVS